MASWEQTLAELAALSPLLEDLNISSDCFKKSKRRPKKNENPVPRNPILLAVESVGNPSSLELNCETILDINENKILDASCNRFQLPQPKQILTDHSILRLNSEPIVNIVEYKNVELGSRNFKKICARIPPSLRVLKIQQVVNPFLKKSFQLTQHFKYSDQKPLQLFHGTKRKYVKSICADNFNWRFSGIERGHKHGKGVNFTPQPLFAIKFCDRAASSKVMILADVLVKNKCLGDKNLVVPPQGYDTAMRKDKLVFVKFSDAEFYPAYLIYFVNYTNNASVK